MDERTHEIAGDKEQAGGISKLLVFTLDDRRYALRLLSVIRVVRAVAVTPLPDAPDTIPGIISLRGEILPVFDTRRRLRLPEREIDVYDQLVFIRTDRRTMALLVDRVAGIISVPDTAITAAESVLPNLPGIPGILQLDGDLILIEDAERFLSLDEEAALDAALDAAGGEFVP